MGGSPAGPASASPRLGPGALNFTTAAAYAHLGAMPMVMITGQKAIMSARQARFQIVDIVAAMRPLTKLTRQIVSARLDPRPSCARRSASRVEERPGPVHLELPEDVAAEEADAGAMVPPHPIERAGRRAAALRPGGGDDPGGQAPADHARRRRQPAAAGRGAVRFRARTGIPFFNTQMGKGAVTGGSNLYLGTAALSERDYMHDAIDRADLIIAIGHDTIEKPPFLMGRAAGGPR